MNNSKIAYQHSKGTYNEGEDSRILKPGTLLYFCTQILLLIMAMNKFKKFLIYIGVVILLGIIGSGSVALFWNYSAGTRAGTVVKFSNKGYLFKTHEGQLNMGGFTTGESGGVTPAVWDFSVRGSNKEVQAALSDAMTQGSRVRLYYKEKLYQYDWRGDTKYFVYKVEKVRD
jgi:hypothetical protein